MEQKSRKWTTNFSLDQKDSFTLDEVKEIYGLIYGKRVETPPEFEKEAIKVAKKTQKGKYIFTNESALYDLFYRFLGTKMFIRGIDSWKAIMKLI